MNQVRTKGAVWVRLGIACELSDVSHATHLMLKLTDVGRCIAPLRDLGAAVDTVGNIVSFLGDATPATLPVTTGLAFVELVGGDGNDHEGETDDGKEHGDDLHGWKFDCEGLCLRGVSDLFVLVCAEIEGIAEVLFELF